MWYGVTFKNVLKPRQKLECHLATENYSAVISAPNKNKLINFDKYGKVFTRKFI